MHGFTTIFLKKEIIVEVCDIGLTRDIMYDITSVIRLSVMTNYYTVLCMKNDILFYNDICFFYILPCADMQ
jgi:hypothetical protein